MANASCSACAHDEHAAWGDPHDSQQSSRLKAIQNAIVESAASCGDRFRTRLPSVARACQVLRPSAATAPMLSGSRSTFRESLRRERREDVLRSDPLRQGRLDRTKTSRSEIRGGLVDTAGLVALPRTPLLQCADESTTLTAAAASASASRSDVYRPCPTTGREARCLPAVSSTCDPTAAMRSRREL